MVQDVYFIPNDSRLHTSDLTSQHVFQAPGDYFPVEYKIVSSFSRSRGYKVIDTHVEVIFQRFGVLE